MAKKASKKSKKQAKEDQQKNLARLIVWPIFILVVVIVGLFFIRNVDDSLTIKEENGFIEIGYSGSEPRYLVISDLKPPAISTPGSGGPQEVNVTGKNSLPLAASTTDYQVVKVDAEGNIKSPTNFDKDQMREKLITIIKNYDSSSDLQLGDYAYEIRETIEE
ncbi:MAG: hypothetical protein KDA65_06575 [Planctomycetaceae bacterium]|nr:hypothetical protein [Planctomycetaceae bacterium]